jgi:hypothetical protein
MNNNAEASLSNTILIIEASEINLELRLST